MPRVSIQAVWPRHHYYRTGDPPVFQFAHIIAKDERGVKHLLTTFSEWMSALCSRYEKDSHGHVRPVELTWDDRKRITSLTEADAEVSA